MPTPVADVPSVWQVTLVQNLYGQQMLNVLHYYNTDVDLFISTMAQAIFDHLNAGGGLIQNMQLVQSGDVSWDSVNVQQVWPTRYAAYKFTEIITAGGVRALPALPSNTAAVLTKQTDFSGRDQIGSLHIGGLTDDERQFDDWTDATITNLQEIANQVFQSVDPGAPGTPLLPILWSPGTPTVRSEITGCIPQRTVRVMRRRTKGVGR